MATTQPESVWEPSQGENASIEEAQTRQGLEDLKEHQQQIRRLEQLVEKVYKEMDMATRNWEALRTAYAERNSLTGGLRNMKYKLDTARDALKKLRDENGKVVDRAKVLARESRMSRIATATKILDVKRGPPPSIVVEEALCVLAAADIPWSQVSEEVLEMVTSPQLKLEAGETQGVQGPLHGTPQELCRFGEPDGGARAIGSG
jgi:hypothetical protein